MEYRFPFTWVSFQDDGNAPPWTGLAPGNRQSGGKRYLGCAPIGNRALATTMVAAAWTRVRTKDSFLKACYHRFAARRGEKHVIVAVAHSMLVSAHHMSTH